MFSIKIFNLWQICAIHGRKGTNNHKTHHLDLRASRAGKTTVAKELVVISEEQVAYIEGDKFWSFFAKGWESVEHGRNFRILMTSMTVAGLSYARAGYEVIP
jgi:hypothetical protein